MDTENWKVGYGKGWRIQVIYHWFTEEKDDSTSGSMYQNFLYMLEMGSEHDFGGTIDFILEKAKKIVTSALWRNPNGDARLKTDVWHIWQKESTCASKFFFAILPFRSWPDKEQQLSSFSGTHMAYFLLVSSIPNVFFQLYHLAKEFRSPSFKNFNNCDFCFQFQ